MNKKTKQSIGPFLEKICLFFIKSGIYLSLFTPLIVSQRSFFPFVTPKTIYFRILIEIIFAFYLILVIFAPRYRPKMNGLFVSILVFILILILTSFLGINLKRSFWSVYERMTGIFTFLHLLAFFIVLTSVFKDKDAWRKFLAVSVLAGVFLCIGLVTTEQVSSRGGGPIGNTSFMAAYLLFNVFFSLFLFFERKHTGWRLFSGLSLLVMIPTLLTSSARGAIISFAMGLFLIFFGYLIFSKQKKIQKIGIFIFSFLVIIAVILLILHPSFIKAKISQTLKEMGPRVAVWETSWKGFLKKPVLGWGLENFNVLFVEFFNPCMFVDECGGEIWFDRAHNIVLDILTTTGIVGFITYLFIFEISIFNLLKICFKRQENMFGPLIMIVLLIVYFFHNMLVFDMISSYVVFFLSLGFISYLIEEDKGSFLNTGYNLPSSFIHTKKTRQIIIGAVALLTVILLFYGNIQPYLGARNIVNMIVLAEGPEESANYFKQSLNTFMDKYEAREQFAQKIVQTSLKSGYPSNIGEFFKLAEQEMEKSIKENPLDYRPHLFLGRTYFAHYRVSQDKDILDLAEKTMEKAKELSPNNQQTYWQLAEIELFKGNYQTSYDLFQYAIDLEPRYGQAYWYLTMAYKITGEYDLAFAELKKAEEHGYNWTQNLETLRHGGEIYSTVQGEEALIKIYEDVLKLEYYARNTEIWANLAASYANAGRLNDAKEAALKVLELDPSLQPSIEEFLKNLGLE